MSVYAINRMIYDAAHDIEFRQQLLDDPDGTLRQRDITAHERSVLLAADVGQLYRMGVLGFMLSYFPRYGLFGLDLEEFGHRMRAEA